MRYQIEPPRATQQGGRSHVTNATAAFHGNKHVSYYGCLETTSLISCFPSLAQVWRQHARRQGHLHILPQWMTVCARLIVRLLLHMHCWYVATGYEQNQYRWNVHTKSRYSEVLHMLFLGLSIYISYFEALAD